MAQNAVWHIPQIETGRRDPQGYLHVAARNQPGSDPILKELLAYPAATFQGSAVYDHAGAYEPFHTLKGGPVILLRKRIAIRVHVCRRGFLPIENHATAERATFR